MRQTGGLSLSAPGREGGGVTIMSIHRSKGLEKPVVLLCGLSRRLNRDDLQRPVLFHPVLGVAPGAWTGSGWWSIPPWPARQWPGSWSGR